MMTTKTSRRWWHDWSGVELGEVAGARGRGGCEGRVHCRQQKAQGEVQPLDRARIP